MKCGVVFFPLLKTKSLLNNNEFVTFLIFLLLPLLFLLLLLWN